MYYSGMTDELGKQTRLYNDRRQLDQNGEIKAESAIFVKKTVVALKYSKFFNIQQLK